MQIDFQQILNGLKKRWWMAVLFAVLETALVYVLVDSQPRIYQAQVTVAAQSVPLDNGMVEAIKKQLVTYASQMASKPFVSDVVDGKYGDPIMDVDPNALVLKTQALPDNQTIVMTVDHADGMVAARVAEAVSNAFIEQEAANNAQTNSSGQKVVWVVTQPATVPSEPYQPRPKLYAAAAALFGLLLGLLLVIGWEMLDTRLKSVEDIQRYVGLNTVGVIPKSKA